MAEPHITDPTLLSVLQAATAARQQCLDLISLLETRGSLQPPSDISEPDDGLYDHERALSARLAILRSLNRKAVYGVRETKAATAEARSEVDTLHLQLQNLFYEQKHLKGEIRGCEEFEHRYTTLPMVSEEEFLAAHEEFRGLGEHEVMMGRIRDELEGRKVLEGRRLELVKRKEALVRETQGKKEELGRLDGEVEKWLGGQEGVRRIFEAREKKIREGEGES